MRCSAFPVVVITSNGERDFPPAFLRRCLQLRLPDPDADRLAAIVAAHLGRADDPRARELIQMSLERSEREGGLAADQLLNAVYLVTAQSHVPGPEWEELLQAVWHRLDSAAGSRWTSTPGVPVPPTFTTSACGSSVPST
ncbi:hypothetical protein ACFY1A_48585 [Streptomyces sp. NPDC001520]|uniref:hypothetical protein n=1 Tax=Streptomyces sp. NPDC001520 TaxID=3364581 RepID=UPI00368B6254